MSRCCIHPSVLSADFANLETELQRISTADAAHIDVMDNRFVPNLTLGLPVVERLQAVSPVPLDIHLMIEDADRWAPGYAEAGCASVTFHAEAARAPIRLARELRGAGSKAGLALRPATPVEPYLDMLTEIDMLLVMTVEPGFGGQKFMADQMEKLRALRAKRPELILEVDGGVNRETAPICRENGADVAVAGTAVFRAENIPAEIALLRGE